MFLISNLKTDYQYLKESISLESSEVFWFIDIESALKNEQKKIPHLIMISVQEVSKTAFENLILLKKHCDKIIIFGQNSFFSDHIKKKLQKIAPVLSLPKLQFFSEYFINGFVQACFNDINIKHFLDPDTQVLTTKITTAQEFVHFISNAHKHLPDSKLFEPEVFKKIIMAIYYQDLYRMRNKEISSFETHFGTDQYSAIFESHVDWPLQNEDELQKVLWQSTFEKNLETESDPLKKLSGILEIPNWLATPKKNFGFVFLYRINLTKVKIVTLFNFMSHQENHTLVYLNFNQEKLPEPVAIENQIVEEVKAPTEKTIPSSEIKKSESAAKSSDSHEPSPEASAQLNKLVLENAKLIETNKMLAEDVKKLMSDRKTPSSDDQLIQIKKTLEDKLKKALFTVNELGIQAKKSLVDLKTLQEKYDVILHENIQLKQTQQGAKSKN